MKMLLLLNKLYRLFQYGPLFFGWLICWVKHTLLTPVKARVPQKGQGLVEYAMIIVLVAIVVIIILALLGPQINRIFGTTWCALQGPSDIMTCFETPEPPDPPEP